MDDIAPGTMLAGRFRVEGAPLGAGSTGVVWPAWDERADRAVAAKVLHAHLVEDGDALRRLQAEAGTAGRLRHPHLVPVLGLWSHEGRWVLVSERVDGVCLARIEGPLSSEAVVALGLELVDALEAVHGPDQVHGDVRPGNVLVGPHGAHLLDVGVSASLARGDDGAETLVLRPGETAPEVLEGAPPQRASDLYGLGVVLYRALTGRLPFDGETPWARIGAQREGRLHPGRGARGVYGLAAELLHPDPARRPPDLGGVRRALERLRRDPERRVRVARRWLAPVRPGRAWVVHGRDPATGGPAVVRERLSASAARGLVRRLTEEGWTVRAERDALALVDLAWIATLTLLLGLAIPLFGLPLGFVLGVRWRSGRLRTELGRALPPVRAPVPPRVATPGAEVAVTVGLLAFASAFLLALKSWLVVLPLALLVWVVVSAARRSPADPARVVRQGRVAAALEDLRGAMDRRALPFDDALGLAGEIEALDGSWRRGEVEDEAVLLRIDDLTSRLAGHAPREAAPMPSLEALRRGDP